MFFDVYPSVMVPGGDGGNTGSEGTKTLKESTLPFTCSVQSQEVGDRDPGNSGH